MGSYDWEFESCDKCGRCYRVAWTIRDDLWRQVVGEAEITLCLDCFIELAERKGIRVQKRDFEWLALFSKLGVEDVVEVRDGK